MEPETDCQKDEWVLGYPGVERFFPTREAADADMRAAVADGRLVVRDGCLVRVGRSMLGRE